MRTRVTDDATGANDDTLAQCYVLANRHMRPDSRASRHFGGASTAHSDVRRLKPASYGFSKVAARA